MRLLAIGDIHGCLTAFDTLLGQLAAGPDDWIISLGDYIDRGPNSRGVLDRLLELSRGGHLIPIRGNHEQMMLDARDDLGLLASWAQYGGFETLASYAPADRDANFGDIPAEHWDFLEHQCVDWFESDRHFFVHAMADPKLPLSEQSMMMLRWAKFNDPPPHRSGKTMICGHTYQESGWPRNIGHAVCIDTWVYGDGWLTGLDVESGQFWQANEAGESRTANLADFLVKPGERLVPHIGR
jgi:serine/threonine protein phosphatase 1